MAITEETRYHLYQRLASNLGREDATVLMEHLPPVGWADVATKSDLDHLRNSITHDIESLELRLRAEMAEKFNRLLFQLLASMAAFVSLVLIIARVV